MSTEQTPSSAAALPTEVILKTSIQFFNVNASVSEQDILALFGGISVSEAPYRWAYGPKQPDLFYWSAKFDTEEDTKRALEAAQSSGTLNGNKVECRIKATRRAETSSVVVSPLIPMQQLAPKQTVRQKGRPAASANRNKQQQQRPELSLGKDDFPSLSAAAAIAPQQQQQQNGEKKFSYAAIASTNSPPPAVLPSPVVSAAPAKQATAAKSKQGKKAAQAVVAEQVKTNEEPAAAPAPQESKPVAPKEQQPETAPAAAPSMWSKSFVQVIKEPTMGGKQEEFKRTNAAAPAATTAGANDNSDNSNWRRKNTSSKKQG